MRAGKYESYVEPFNPSSARVSQYRSAVEVTCLAEESDDAEDAAACVTARTRAIIAAAVRKYYGIAARKSAG